MKKAVSILLTVLLLVGCIPLSVFVASAESTLDTTNLAENYKYNSGAGEVSWDFGDRWNTDDPSVSAHGGYGWKIPQWNGWGGGNVYGKSICVKASGLETDTRYQFGFSNGGKFDMAVTKVYPVSNPSAMLELLNVQRTAVSNPIYTGYQWFDVKTDFVTNSTDTEYIVVIQATNTGRSGDEVAFADLKLYKYLSFGESFDVSVAVEGGGTATVSSTNVEAGATVTFTAAAKHLDTFLGWYDGENLVSSELVYEPTITATTNLTAKFTAHTTSENLVKDLSYGNGITVTYTDWSRNTTAGETRYGGNGIKLGNGDFDSATNGITLSVTLQANTAYRFGFSNSGDHRMVLESVRSATGVLAPIVKASEPTNSGWIGTDYTFITGDETNYVLTVTAYARSKNGSHRDNVGWSDATVSDFALFKLNDYDFSANLAAGFTHEGGEVTWTENAENTASDKTGGVLGGYRWKFAISQTNTSDNIAYVTIKASHLKADTCYEFSYVYSKDYKILFDSVTSPDSSAASIISEAIDTTLGVGDRAHKISFVFETSSAGDYIVKLKMGKGWNNTDCNWGDTVLSDLSLTEKTYPLPEEITGFPGTAMRTQGKQALRYKFSISKDLVNNGVDGYEVVEYGSVAIRTDYLNGKALVKGGEYTVGDTVKKAVSGAAYNREAGTQIVFDETENDYLYTAALVNIGYNKVTAETDYAVWGYDYSVRSYIVLRDTATGALATIYDATTQQASVFAVMYEILTSTSPDAQDHIAMQAILDSNTAIANAYSAWKTTKGY